MDRKIIHNKIQKKNKKLKKIHKKKKLRKLKKTTVIDFAKIYRRNSFGSMLDDLNHEGIEIFL